MRHGILFSGGLDSLCAAVLNPGMALVRVSTGSKYDETERRHARLIANALGRELIEDDSLNLGKHEQVDALVPGRNALIALIGAQHVDRLSLISVDGDGTHAPDKDGEFAVMMTMLMRKLFVNDDAALLLPYRSYSKVQLLNHAKRCQPAALAKVIPYVFSCYTPTLPADAPDSGWHMHCGRCKACVRLWAALYACGFPGAICFDKGPWRMPRAEFNAVFEGRGHEARVADQSYVHANTASTTVYLTDEELLP